jgi:autophagy-related protein 9
MLKHAHLLFSYVHLFSRFIAFISGSFAGILAIITLFDSEALLNFELTPNGTILFYIGLFGGIFAVSRGLIPNDTLVFEPEQDLRKVIEITHYFPNEWRGKLHTDEVRGQFSQMFDMKITLFLQEILSILFTPLVLWYSLPQSSTQIIDFFREFTVHVDGLGYVCSFALFDFRRHGNVKYGAPVAIEDEHYVSNGGKMEKSFLNFKVCLIADTTSIQHDNCLIFIVLICIIITGQQSNVDAVRSSWLTVSLTHGRIQRP